MKQKSVSEIFLLSVISLQFWLPTIYGTRGAGHRRLARHTPQYKNRRQWRYPEPARRPVNATTEEPFDPRKENENFTGTVDVENQYTTREKQYEKTTTLLRSSFKEDCDNIAFFCMRAYDTGLVCARTMYYNYATFDNICVMDYVNCMQRYDLWHITHMGKCIVVKELKDFDHYTYQDDYFLDNMWISD